MDDRHQRFDVLTRSLGRRHLAALGAGGVITVVAPLAVASWGLPVWTGFCFGLVLLAGSAGLLVMRLGRDTEASATGP